MLKQEKAMQAFEMAREKVDAMLDRFTDQSPVDTTKALVYKDIGGFSWTEGFWPGMLWICYEITGDEKYKTAGMKQLELFKTRWETDSNMDHHDIGFLYSLSAVAAYKVTGDETAKTVALGAADALCRRFQPVGGFIQAWGEMGAEDNYRLIIDCLLNIPLLFWATEISGDSKYRKIAESHLHAAVNTVFREDGTTFHTYFFDPVTGAPTKGVTAQGYSDDSCWARGQAWGVVGLALAYRATGDEKLLPLYDKVTKYFIEHLPADHVAYWDMIFTEGTEPRDTSAPAIAACGIYEMKREGHPEFEKAADEMMVSLIDNYTTHCMSYCDGLLTDGMYSRPNGDDSECTLWGDYFYLEAIMRCLKPDWKGYWL